MPFFNSSQMGSRQGLGAWPGMMGQQAAAAPSLWNRMRPSMPAQNPGVQQMPTPPMQPGGFGSTPGITQIQPPPMTPGGFGSTPGYEQVGGMMNGGGPSVLPPAPNVQGGIVDPRRGKMQGLGFSGYNGWRQ